MQAASETVSLAVNSGSAKAISMDRIETGTIWRKRVEVEIYSDSTTPVGFAALQPTCPAQSVQTVQQRGLNSPITPVLRRLQYASP